MLKKTRRIITGMNENQISSVLSEDYVKTVTPSPLFPTFQIQDLFYTEDTPQSLATRHLDKPYHIRLPEGAMRVMKVRMPTKVEVIAELKKANQPLPQDWTKFRFHSTDSIDYIYILSGTITCIVGEQSVQLRKGDFLAQIGAEHTWINDNEKPCYALCMMVGTKPKLPVTLGHSGHTKRR